MNAPRSAYLHVPFCAHRCGYCNFTLVAGRDDLVPVYLRAIALELAQLAEPQPVETLYFGGGTPTQLPRQQFEQLAETALRWHPPVDGYEWTVEANPADVDEDMIACLTGLGVTRISLGGQSFQPRKLQLLERDHSPDEFLRAVTLAQQAGLSVAIDLIFATPGETLAEWIADVRSAIELKPDHISTYGLTIERGTQFFNRVHRGELIELPDQLQGALYEHAIDTLAAAGYEHYEVSNFAQPGQRSRHNQVYWCGEGYYAAGPGAARYVGGVRETNHRSTTTYLKRVLAGESPVAEREQLTPEQRARELLVFGLRRLEGVNGVEFSERTGFEIEQLAGDAVQRFVEQGLLQTTSNAVRLTREGLLVSDALWPELL